MAEQNGQQLCFHIQKLRQGQPITYCRINLARSCRWLIKMASPLLMMQTSCTCPLLYLWSLCCCLAQPAGEQNQEQSLHQHQPILLSLLSDVMFSGCATLPKKKAQASLLGGLILQKPPHCLLGISVSSLHISG